jgi:FeS assembly protein IscX
MKHLTWDDSEEIAQALWEKYPNIPAVALDDEEIREKVIALDNFNDTPYPKYSVYLAGIQRSWIMAGHGKYAEESIKRAARRPEP